MKVDALAKPYEIWKEHFIEDRCCSKEEVHKEFLIAALPHIILNLVLFLYFHLGAIIFQVLDPEIRQKPLDEAALFCFITTSTIGWGNIYPVTFASKLFSIFYIAIGTPLTYVVLGNNGEFVIDLYWIFAKSYLPTKYSEPKEDKIPFVVSYGLLLLYIFSGAVLYSFFADDKSLFHSFYLTFISITTIGYGDEVPHLDKKWETYATMLFMAIGVIIVTLVITSIQSLFEKVHNLGRSGMINNVESIEVWFGGKPMTVAELVHVVADHFKVQPEKLKDVLKDLDHILEAAVESSKITDSEQSTLLSPISDLESPSIAINNAPPNQNILQLSRHPSLGSTSNCQLTICSNQLSVTRTFSEIPFARRHSTSSLQKDNENALHALRVITYKVQKTELIRQNSRTSLVSQLRRYPTASPLAQESPKK